MSIKVLDRVWKSSKAKGGDLLLLLAIADNADEKTGSAYPSINYLAKKTRLTERAVQYSLRRLEALGELTIQPKAAANGCNLFTIKGAIFSGVQSFQGEAHCTAGGEADFTRGGANGDNGVVKPTAPKPSVKITVSKDNHQEQPSDAPALAVVKKNPPNPKNLETWKAYADAYFARYSTEPVRNAKVNGQIAQLVKRLGADAPHVAAWYVQHNGAFYVRSSHAVGPLVQNCEGLHTEWVNGTAMTDTRARQTDRKQSNFNVVQQLIAEERAKNGN